MMLERKEWLAEDLICETEALQYIQKTLQLSDKTMYVILKYHLAGVNGRMVKKDSVVQNGDFLSVTIPDPIPPKWLPEDYPLDILYEDDDLLVLNKEKGMAVIPGPGNWHHNVHHALMHYFGGDDPYIGLVHRIDRTTSGCLLVGKNKKVTALLNQEIRNKTCYRIYDALVSGQVREDGVIDAPIGRDPQAFRRMSVPGEDGKEARTMYHVKEIMHDASELQLRLDTGRTHQIRVHMAHIGHPLIGDELYGTAFAPIDTQGALLHAGTIIFTHPKTGAEMTVTAQPPQIYTTAKQLLKQNS